MKQILASSLLAVMANPELSALERVRSDRSVTATTDLLEDILREIGVPVSARVDHEEGAVWGAQSLARAQLLIFVPPGAEEKVPLRVLVYEDESGEIWLRYGEIEADNYRANPDVCAAQMESALVAIAREAA
ncbi:hypothetical protein ACX9MO_01445 [Pseudooceanicola sp. 502str34]|jgi:uncharacterized protein (DUF302 family)